MKLSRVEVIDQGAIGHERARKPNNLSQGLDRESTRFIFHLSLKSELFDNVWGDFLCLGRVDEIAHGTRWFVTGLLVETWLTDVI